MKVSQVRPVKWPAKCQLPDVETILNCARVVLGSEPQAVQFTTPLFFSPPGVVNALVYACAGALLFTR